MDLNLDNGETISLWDMRDLKGDSATAWGTILHADNTQEVVKIEPIAGGDYWTSPVSKNRYPTSFTVRIPAKNAELKVTTTVKDQEIVCRIPLFTKYESGSDVSGVYDEKNVGGYTFRR